VGLPNGLVIDRDDVIDVRLKKPVKIASLSVDDTFTVEVANDLPISSNSDVGLPPGTEIVARVTAIEDSPDRMVTVVFDRIIAPNGQVYPFLGGMSTSGGGGSPRWLQRQIDDGRDRASANEGLAGMTAWAGMGDHPILTAIAIPTVSLLTRKVMSARNAVRQQKAEAKSALSFITDDLPAARFSVRAARTFHY
jgi:hypothetical protein